MKAATLKVRKDFVVAYKILTELIQRSATIQSALILMKELKNSNLGKARSGANTATERTREFCIVHPQ